MNNIKPYIDALLRIWHENSPAGRVGIVLMAVVGAVVIGGVGYWSVQPSYVVLVSEADSEKMNRVIDALDRENIKYTIGGAGGNLMVDQRDFAKAKMIARSNGVSSSGQSSGVFGSAFGTPTERRNQARLQKQNQLAATIAKMNVVDQADVHLNVPDKGPFERKKSKPTASVLLTLHADAQLSEQQATSIASLVAFAVEDLQPTDVQITDKDGNIYSVPNEDVQHITNQVEFVTHAEKRLAHKAEEQLYHFLGHGNASVQVSLDYSFKSGSTTSKTYDPNGKVAQEEDIMSQSTTGKDDGPGPAGVASNLQSRRQRSGTIEEKTENIKTSYLVPVTEETTANTTPVRNLMTVSVIVNSRAEGLANEDGTMLPGVDQKVTSIVKNAVGFREESDVISVELLPFPEVDLEGAIPAAPFEWGNVISIVEKASIAIAAILAFLMGMMLLKKLNPIAESAQIDAKEVDHERMENVTQLSTLVREHPEVFERIVRVWSGNDEGEQELRNESKAA